MLIPFDRVAEFVRLVLTRVPDRCAFSLQAQHHLEKKIKTKSGWKHFATFADLICILPINSSCSLYLCWTMKCCKKGNAFRLEINSIVDRDLLCKSNTSVYIVSLFIRLIRDWRVTLLRIFSQSLKCHRRYFINLQTCFLFTQPCVAVHIFFFFFWETRHFR